MTVIQKRPDNPVAHLTEADIETIRQELDAIRKEVFASLGEEEAAYIRNMIKTQRTLELGSRAILLFSLFPPAWLIGTAGLSLAKILENMEIGHNIMHGQWDWMRDPAIHSSTWEWDNASPADQWKHSHNEIHHQFTNVVGKDNDLGYGVMRVDEDQAWRPEILLQPLWNFLVMCLFEYAVAIHDLDLARVSRGKAPADEEFKGKGRAILRKVRRQMRKDYLIHPLLSGPSAPTTLAANAVANLVRNVWTHSVIMCGHFPEGVATFSKTSIEGETKGEWYIRQMVGAANISGAPLFHVMTGNLSFQIEHHIYPDMPSIRYQEISPRIKELFERYDLPYVTGPFHKQLASAWLKVIRLSLPNSIAGHKYPEVDAPVVPEAVAA